MGKEESGPKQHTEKELRAGETEAGRALLAGEGAERRQEEGNETCGLVWGECGVRRGLREEGVTGQEDPDH